MEDIPKPSGSMLPLLLRKCEERKLQSERAPASRPSVEPTNNKSLSSAGLPISAEVNNFLNYPGLSRTEHSSLPNSTFTVEEIEAQMERVWKAIVLDIQRQIHRGEEVYFEDTHAHGNLFRGWDTFVDLKDVGNGNSATSAPQTSRRVPQDYRWFSGSCRSVTRIVRPAQLKRELAVHQSSLPAPSLSVNPLGGSILASEPSETSLKSGKDGYSGPSKCASNKTVQPSTVQSVKTGSVAWKSSETDTEMITRLTDQGQRNLPSGGLKRKKEDEDINQGEPQKKPMLEGAEPETTETDKKVVSILPSPQAAADSMDVEELTSGQAEKEGMGESPDGNAGGTAAQSEAMFEVEAVVKRDLNEESKNDGKSKKEDASKRRSSRNRK